MKHHYHWEPREKAIKLGTRERIKENEKESGAQLGLIFCTFFFHILLSKDYLTANPVYTSMVSPEPVYQQLYKGGLSPPKYREGTN